MSWPTYVSSIQYLVWADYLSAHPVLSFRKRCRDLQVNSTVSKWGASSTLGWVVKVVFAGHSQSEQSLQKPCIWFFLKDENWHHDIKLTNWHKVVGISWNEEIITEILVPLLLRKWKKWTGRGHFAMKREVQNLQVHAEKHEILSLNVQECGCKVFPHRNTFLQAKHMK